MLKRFLAAFAVLGLSVASAESYNLVLESTQVEGANLKAGDYRLELQDGKAVITHGKRKLEFPVQVENANQKYASTKVVYTSNNGRYAIREIQLAGTTTKLVFSAVSASGSN